MTQTLPADPEPLIRQLYASFNARSIDAVLAGLASDVVWANGLGEGCPGRDRQVRGPNAELRGTALGTASVGG